MASSRSQSVRQDREDRLGKEQKLATFFLRTGLAVVFLYAGISTLLNSSAWIGFVPHWLGVVIPREVFLFVHGLFDICIGIWLMSGKKQFYSSLFASLSLASIVIFNIGVLDIVFRDIALLFAAVALMVFSFKEVGVSS
ncbi:hypothetical protein HY496_00170 [Candidatus Woesearchaeota archaeon]|nr:hypothetical protein [Candidatus Woesearchaeota archaeon]